MKNRNPRWGLLILIGFGDLIIINASFVLAYFLRFRTNVLPPPVADAPLSAYLKALIFISYVSLPLLKLYNLYDFRRTRTLMDHTNGIVSAITFTMMILLSTTFFYRDFSYSRMVCFMAWGISIFSLSAFRACLLHVSIWLRERGYDQKEVVIVGSYDEMTHILLDKLKNIKGLGYHFLGIIHIPLISDIPSGDRLSLKDQPPHSIFLPELGPFSDAMTLIEEREPDIVIVTQPTIPHYPLLDLIECCERLGISLLMMPKIYDLLINMDDVHDLDGIPLVSLKECQQNVGYLLIKRCFDLIVSAFALILSLPLFLLIAILIKLDSPGNVIFLQERVGQNGRIFKMFKFRTMIQDAEAHLKDLVDLDALPEPVFKLENDVRVTRVGRILRRLSLDELPQLLNVLRGDMSLVGPRPEEKAVVQRYNIWQRRRLKVKPGITGLQQITNRGIPDLSERIKYDIYYLRKQSFLFDLAILIRTISVVISGKGAF